MCSRVLLATYAREEKESKLSKEKYARATPVGCSPTARVALELYAVGVMPRVAGGNLVTHAEVHSSRKIVGLK
jgi:hypothetical protein